MLHALYHALAWTWGGDGQGGPNGDGYLITSGPAAALAVVGGLLAWAWRTRCETRGCWRLAWREDHNGAKLCRRHYEEGTPGIEHFIDEARRANERRSDG